MAQLNIQTVSLTYGAAGWATLVQKASGQRVVIRALALSSSANVTVRLRGSSEKSRYNLPANGPPLVLPFPADSDEYWMKGDSGKAIELYCSGAAIVVGTIAYVQEPNISGNIGNA